MNLEFLDFITRELAQIKEASLYKEERVITSSQDAWIELSDSRKVLNLCANNYLGLANHPDLIEAAKKTMDHVGFGMASVRFICGTLDLHIALEKKISEFLKAEATLLYSSCFDANGGLFETILGPDDVILSDSLNHASIIDGVRLSKAERVRFESNNMEDLEAKLQAASGKRFRLIATDGVFSMDGVIANLPKICELKERYQALLMIDDCHSTGFLGKEGRGTHEYHNVIGQVDILTGTLGKALGGASGGYISSKKEIIDLLRQRSRPYLFSNALAPPIVGASLELFNLLEREGKNRRENLHRNTRYFREKMTSAGFKILGKDHPISPIYLGEANLAQTFARRMLEKGVYVIGFFFPVVPKGGARIRTQMSAAHTLEDLDFAISAFTAVGKELNVI